MSVTCKTRADYIYWINAISSLDEGNLWAKRKDFIFCILHIQIIKWIIQRNERNRFRPAMQNIQDDWFILCTHQNSYFQIYNTNNVAIKVNPGVSLPYVFYRRLKDLCIKISHSLYLLLSNSRRESGVWWDHRACSNNKCWILKALHYPLRTYTGRFTFIAGSLESANSSILAPCRLFKEVVGKKSGFYVN